MLRKFIDDYFKKDTSRSNKSNLIKLLISDKEKLDEINSFINFGNFKQKLYHYLNNINEQPKCIICESNVNWNEKDFCYRETCSSKCSGKLNLCRKSSKETIHPIFQTIEEHYNYFKSGKIKITKSSISKYYPEIFKSCNLILFTDDFNQKVYCYLKNINEYPKCKYCKVNYVEFDTFSQGFHDYCSVKCSSNSIEKKIKTKNTNQSKYGVDNISTTTRKKASSTMIDKYGSHISLTGEFKQKFKETSLNKYGVEHPFKSDEIKGKIKTKNLEIYGVDNPMKLQKTIQKVLQTKKEKGIIFKWSDEELEKYEKYRQKVTYISEKNYNEYRDLINPENLERGHLTYHLDHIYPVILGFIKNIDVELISNYKNLQLLPHIENRIKGDRTNMSIQDFYRLLS